MLLSIIIVTLNAEATLRNCLQSLRDQNSKNFEIIHIDGGSKDSTMEIASSFRDLRIRSISESDSGLYFAMNKGLNLASGDVFSILNSDDVYLASTVELVISHFKRNKNTDVLCGNTLHSERGLLKPNPTNLDMEMIPHPSSFIRATSLNRIGNFNTKYRVAADYDLMLRFKASGANFVTIDETLAVMQAGGYSEVNKKISIEETLFLQRKHNQWSTARYIFYWIKYHFGTYARGRFRFIKGKVH